MSPLLGSRFSIELNTIIMPPFQGLATHKSRSDDMIIEKKLDFFFRKSRRDEIESCMKKPRSTFNYTKEIEG